MVKRSNKTVTNSSNKKQKELRVKDLSDKSHSFLSKHKNWFSNMFCAFVATVLGIAVTFGVSRCSEHIKNKEIIKTSVFNALSDLDNYEDFLRSEDSIFAEIKWLPRTIDSFYRNDSIQTDSLAKKINYIFGFRNHFKKDYKPIGKDFLSQCQVKNVDDLETFRIINIAYEDALQSYAFLEKMKRCIEDLNNIWLGMYYSHNHYSSSDVVKAILSQDSAHKLCLMLNERFLYDGETLEFFDYYIKMIDFHRQRILLFAGTDMEEYQNFKEERKRHQ